MEEFKYNRALFQNLKPENHRWNSPAVDSYNCIAFAAGDETQPWWPMEGYHWPLPFPPEDECDNFKHFVAGFKTLGYNPCNDGAPEANCDKVALYGVLKEDQMTIKHAAIQLQNGEWASKMGEDKSPDIIHSTPEAICGLLYGTEIRFLKRGPK